MYSTFKIYTITGDPIALGKQISPFVSHIRLALMVDFAVFALVWLFHIEENAKFRYIFLFLIIWFCFFLFILQSLTGIVVLLTVAIFYVIVIAFKSKILLVKWFCVIGIALLLLLPSTYFVHMYTANFSPEPLDTTSLERVTVNGNAYHHDTKHLYLENGNYIYLYICEKELKSEWEKRSTLNYDSLDNGGNPLKYTLFRYLTALGLRKDSAGVSQLSQTDISHIENSIANPIYIEKSGIKPRVYRVMWELYHYRLGADPSGYSVAQRIEYLKTAFHIIHRNFWFGTGTGDVVNAFQLQYKEDNSPLNPKWQLRAHNQFVTFFLTFGLVGFLVIMFSLFVSPMLKKRFNDYLFLTFFIIFALSMLNEDTLETHASISFIALFYALLLFSENRYKPLIVGKEHVEVG
ncbi:MAG TPA: O-antigen ligase family protein [Bacteroidales bacterium]|nr:O-antigen ligase family protein [Bacteroidales bacterium]